MSKSTLYTGERRYKDTNMCISLLAGRCTSGRGWEERPATFISKNRFMRTERTQNSHWSEVPHELLRISLICVFRIFSRFRTAFDGRRSTQAWLQNLASFQV
jgi:hypothetical protein